MCGICGLISRSPIAPEERSTLKRVNAALRHRGPDGEGEHEASHVHLAMRRLAIIDLQGGWQPLFNEDKSIALVANGEVYNFVELRERLEGLGHRFRTKSDCETIVHAYEQWGMEFVHELRGMYAFALHDTKNRKVIIVRDRMGEKPMYLHERDGQIWFSSELRSLMAGQHIPFEIDPGAINLFLHFAYVPDPYTPVVGVRKLPPGHMLSIDLDPWHMEQRCYWRLDDAPPVEGDAPTLIREELIRIGELITRADVPVAVALSGGVDSSAIAALAARARPGQIHALTVGYPGTPKQDERGEAKAFADALNMPFHQVEVPTREVVELFPERAFWRDDPIADIAGHSYFAVARLSRQLNIPVLLKGQGGDELFWGYSWVREGVARSREKAGIGYGPGVVPYRNGTGGWKGALRNAVGRIEGWRPRDPVAGTPADELAFYNLSDAYQRGAFAAPRILTPAFLKRARELDPASLFRVPTPWRDIPVHITKLICDTYLVENGMVQGDRLSMVNSVEVRLPLCDYKLAELAVGLRKANPDDHLPPKHHFRKALEGLVPDWVLNRPKRGFAPPFGEWLPALTAAYTHSLEDGYLVGHGILEREAAGWLSDHHPRLSMWPDIFYRCLALEFWCRGVENVASRVDRHRFQRVPQLA